VNLPGSKRTTERPGTDAWGVRLRELTRAVSFSARAMREALRVRVLTLEWGNPERGCAAGEIGVAQNSSRIKFDRGFETL
jgi:hypothetical protein